MQLSQIRLTFPTRLTNVLFLFLGEKIRQTFNPQENPLGNHPRTPIPFSVCRLTYLLHFAETRWFQRLTVQTTENTNQMTEYANAEKKTTKTFIFPSRRDSWRTNASLKALETISQGQEKTEEGF